MSIAKPSRAQGVPRISLDELLAANQVLATVYVMKAGLQALWSVGTGWEWKAWLEQAKESGIASLALRQAAVWLLEEHLEPGALVDAHRPARRNQQPDQSDEADGLWLPGQRIFLPEDQSRFPG